MPKSVPELKIARGFSLPPQAVTQTFAIMARRGAGKACPTCDQTDHGWWREDVPVTHSLAGFTFVGTGESPPSTD